MYVCMYVNDFVSRQRWTQARSARTPFDRRADADWSTEHLLYFVVVQMRTGVGETRDRSTTLTRLVADTQPTSV